MIRSSIYKELGMFDESYFIFMEETDFCWRAHLRGYRVVFAPKAIVWHAYRTPLKESSHYYTQHMVRFLGCRNYITTLLKNVSTGDLVKILPFHILSWICLSLLFLLQGKFIDSVLIVKGIFWNLLHMGKIISKRDFVQKKLRRVSDRVIFSKFMIRRSMHFYFKKACCYLKNTPLRS